VENIKLEISNNAYKFKGNALVKKIQVHLFYILRYFYNEY